MTTCRFTVPSTNEMEDILEVAKRTGNYSNIVIADNLKVSFIKTHENFLKCGIDMVCDEGEGEGATLHFTKREIFDKDWKVILADRLLECNHYFNKDEIKLIESIPKFVLQHGTAEKSGEDMTLRQILNELHFYAKAFNEVEKVEGDAFVRIKIWKIEKLDQECICINSAALDEFLEEIGASSWKKLKLKKELKHRKLSVTNQGLNYDFRIQTEEARKVTTAMKFVVIPLNNLESWLETEEEDESKTDGKKLRQDGFYELPIGKSVNIFTGEVDENDE